MTLGELFDADAWAALPVSDLWLAGFCVMLTIGSARLLVGIIRALSESPND